MILISQAAAEPMILLGMAALACLTVICLVIVNSKFSGSFEIRIPFPVMKEAFVFKLNKDEISREKSPLVKTKEG